jgi:hypothetical protein
VLLWFAVTAPILVAEVFRSPMVDYRLVALGAILPLVEIVTGRFVGLHTLAGAVLALGLVMAVTTGRRLVRRRLLGVPIGLFCHLVLDATWARTEVFWWPAFGAQGPAVLPEQDRSWWVLLVLELVAAGLALWARQRYGLDDPTNRRLLVRRGHLARGVITTRGER